jgi:hypothetical protein
MSSATDNLQELLEQTKLTVPDVFTIVIADFDFSPISSPPAKPLSRFTPRSSNISLREQNQMVKAAAKLTPFIPH